MTLFMIDGLLQYREGPEYIFHMPFATIARSPFLRCRGPRSSESFECRTPRIWGVLLPRLEIAHQ
jgi:hypothetical protein